ALIAAHNEELVIEKSIASVTALFSPSEVYLVSDGSSDSTAEKARAAGVNVLELHPNRGKGGALAAGVEHFELCRRYQVVLLLDADTLLSPDYLDTGLPLFADCEVVAVAGRPRSFWRPGQMSHRAQFIAAYRAMVYLRALEFTKYGQGWRHANAVVVVPGFASMYRTSALAHIDINAPGLVVEDLNMTFDVHHKRLGRIAFHPAAAIGYTQDPATWGDYVRQVRRWSLVLWQTVRRHGFLHRGLFWAGLTLYMAEVITSSIVAILFPFGLALEAAAGVLGHDLASTGGILGGLFGVISIENFLIAVVLPQVLFTMLVSTLHRRPRYLLFALGFPILWIIDSFVHLYTIPRAWIDRSTGAWTSPVRQPL
ncbi:glycosyltransferase family 2 protein, partial [Actinoplanes sp. NPDC051633]|uniref:glycosyltransferase family 2 protein n=1 Tax=Actinoplanes sp. NPDC051633 TaxID=3155670 RepID=UPI003440E2F5